MKRMIICMSVVLISSIALLIAGCNGGGKGLKITVEGGGKFPEHLAGTWKGDQQGWEVFNDYGIGVVLLCYEIDTDNWELNPIGSGDLECENKALGDRTVDGFTFRRRITLCVYDSTGQTCNLSPSHDQIEEDPRLVTVEVLWNLIDPSDWLSGKVERVASSIILTRWAND